MKLNLNTIKNIVLLLLIVLPGWVHGQKWVADTICVSFGAVKNLDASFNLHTVVDHRAVEPGFISVYEQKKWLFFPVDQIVYTTLPFAKSLENHFSNDTLDHLNFKVDIHEFYISNTTSMGKRQLVLYSSLELSKIVRKDTVFLGTVYYDQSVKHKKKAPASEGYELMLNEWSKRFTSDLIAVDQELDQIMPYHLYHFRRDKRAVKRNFYVEAELFGGLNFWGVDGELWFSEPEGNRVFNRSAGIMRYVNHPDFQAIAFGSNVRLWNYRIDPKWLFTNKMALLIGFNNWKDMDTVPHKLEEIPFFNCSFTQRINYNPFDQSGLVFGIGIMEDVHYIIYHQPKINVGLTLNLAYKF